ncbi:hypothetical protein LEMLEM_LOCUS12210 [Lemmus lemmus]
MSQGHGAEEPLSLVLGGQGEKVPPLHFISTLDVDMSLSWLCILPGELKHHF